MSYMDEQAVQGLQQLQRSLANCHFKVANELRALELKSEYIPWNHVQEQFMRLTALITEISGVVQTSAAVLNASAGVIQARLLQQIKQKSTIQPEDTKKVKKKHKRKNPAKSLDAVDHQILMKALKRLDQTTADKIYSTQAGEYLSQDFKRVPTMTGMEDPQQKTSLDEFDNQALKKSVKILNTATKATIMCEGFNPPPKDTPMKYVTPTQAARPQYSSNSTLSEKLGLSAETQLGHSHRRRKHKRKLDEFEEC